MRLGTVRWGPLVAGHGKSAPLKAGLVVLLVVVNALLSASLFEQLLRDWFRGYDYDVLARASLLANPYSEPWYVWSPVAVWPLKLLPLIGEHGLWILHVAWLVPLGWPLGAIVGLSWPFWYDLVTGNVLMLVAMLGYLTLRGSRPAAIGFMVMALLVPRPLMIPLAAWLLWKEPWSRPWFVGLFVAHAAAVLATGLGPAWIDRLLHVPGGIGSPGNFAPSRWIGVAWIPIGVALAGWLTWRGRLGLESLAVQPYLLPPYLLMLLLELRSPRSGS